MKYLGEYIAIMEAYLAYHFYGLTVFMIKIQ